MNEAQAKGGAGLLFNMAKEKLGSGDFQHIAANVPGMTDLLGLSTDMIGKFVPVVLSFLQNQGGESVKGLLEKVLQPS